MKQTNTEISNKDNPNGVTPNPNKLWVNKASGLICRVLSRTDNPNICEFWVLPSGSDIPIAQVAHTLQPLEYHGIDYGGYDISTKQWTKYHFNNIPILHLFWKNGVVMVKLGDDTEQPVERVISHLHTISVNTPTNRQLAIQSLIVDDNLQMRVAIDDSVIDDYAFLMKDGVEFPPLIVFEDGSQQYWLVDGFHRYYAYKLNNTKYIPCTIHKGDFFHARLFALSANSTHGLPRSNEDKRKAVLEALFDPELSLHSNRQIALYCGVSRRFVDKLRNQLLKENSTPDCYHKENTITTISEDNKTTSVINTHDNNGHIPTPVIDTPETISETPTTTETVIAKDSKPKPHGAYKHRSQVAVTAPLIDVSRLYELRDKALNSIKVGSQSKQYKDTKKLLDLFINELLRLYN